MNYFPPTLAKFTTPKELTELYNSINSLSPKDFRNLNYYSIQFENSYFVDVNAITNIPNSFGVLLSKNHNKDEQFFLNGNGTAIFDLNQRYQINNSLILFDTADIQPDSIPTIWTQISFYIFYFS